MDTKQSKRAKFSQLREVEFPLRGWHSLRIYTLAEGFGPDCVLDTGRDVTGKPGESRADVYIRADVRRHPADVRFLDTLGDRP